MYIVPKSIYIDALPSSLIDSNVSLRRKQRKNKELRTRSLVWNTWGGGKVVLELWDGTKKNDKYLITHTNLHKTKQQVG
jgi:hypothetical protein